MTEITNKFKQRLINGELQFGIWNGINNTIVAEILAGSGFDWILIDAEHGPFDIGTIQHQLQAISRFNIPVVVRPPVGEQILVKQLMDIGVQSLLVPVVETADHARNCARYMRYPPEGVRGVGTALARAAQWNRVDQYFEKSNEQMCLTVQVETLKGVQNLEAILEIKDVDAVFIGPADLAASMGYLGQPGHPDVVAKVNYCLEKITSSNKQAGILTGSKELMSNYIAKGVKMVGVGIDTLLLSSAAKELAEYYLPQKKHSKSNTTY